MAETPRQVIGRLADQLERRSEAFERARDPRCVFARAYASLTHVLADAVPRAGFRDQAWVTQLALVFAEHYLRALREHDQGTLHRGAWASVFAASERSKTSVLEELVLGMTAHIVHDLPLALCEVGLTAPDGSSRISDYHLLNDVLGRTIPEIQTELTRRYEPLLGILDHLFEDYDEILTDYGLRISRAAAWYNAHRLLDPASRENAREAIARSPAVTLAEILDPPLLSVRFAFRIARLISRITRRWPSAPRARQGREQEVRPGYGQAAPHST